jgi:hypothetical protein
MAIGELVLLIIELALTTVFIPLTIHLIKTRKENRRLAIENQQRICYKLDEIASALLDLAKDGKISESSKSKLKQIVEKELNNV